MTFVVRKNCWNLFDLRGKNVIADKGYDSGWFVHWLEEGGL